MIALHVLASGSKGNAAVVEDAATGEGLLVDCGVTAKALIERCEQAGFDPLRLRAVLVTHDHSDHVKGLGVALRCLRRRARKLGVAWQAPAVHALPAVQAAATRAFAEAAEEAEVRPLALGERACFGALAVTPFATSHDAAASCGFRIEHSAGDALGYLTDTGCLTPEAASALRDVRLLALESNHDPLMLKNGDYPAMLKARVASDRGHLSNEQAAEALATLLGPRLECVVAMHLSENNNRPAIAERTLREVLDACGHPARIEVAAQHMLVSVR